jgi:hypothetical protein
VDSSDLARLVAELRSVGSDTHSVEVKAAAGKLPRSVTETLSAFSNSAGGTLILGLDEGTGFRPAAGFDAVSAREALARACADDIFPPVRSVVEIIPFEGASVVVTEVPEISPLSKPAYVRGRGEYQGSFVRGGDGDRKLSDYEVGLLHANRGQPRDDREPVMDASAASSPTATGSSARTGARGSPPCSSNCAAPAPRPSSSPTRSATSRDAAACWWRSGPGSPLSIQRPTCSSGRPAGTIRPPGSPMRLWAGPVAAAVPLGVPSARARALPGLALRRRVLAAWPAVWRASGER